jgi:hypothetical protein
LETLKRHVGVEKATVIEGIAGADTKAGNKKPSTATAPTLSETQRQIETARKLLNAGKYTEALAQLREAAKSAGQAGEEMGTSAGTKTKERVDGLLTQIGSLLEMVRKETQATEGKEKDELNATAPKSMPK